MADPITVPETDDDTGSGPDGKSGAPAPAYPGAPRWVKVSALVALVVILLVVIAMALGGGNHGPDRHLPSGGVGGGRAVATQWA